MNKIFGIGIGKTGTTSLAEALKILGFQGADHPYPELLQAFMLDALDFGTDLPFSTRFKEMDKLFPDSKFIMTVRTDINEWITSVENQHKKWPNEKMKQWALDYRQEMYGGLYFDRMNQFETRAAHETEIISYFRKRPNDLLIMNIFEGDGWNELCSFLDVPIPDVPFPHLNKRKQL